MVSRSSEEADRTRACWVVGACMLIGLGFLAAVHLRQGAFQERAEGAFARDAMRLASVWDYRAPLCDRYGTPLNATVESFALAVHPSLLRDIRHTRTQTLNLVEAEVSSLAIELWPDEAQYRRVAREDLRAHLVRASPMPFVLWRNLDNDTLQRWLMVRREYPGMVLLRLPKRVYHLPDLAPTIRGRASLTRRGAPGLVEACDFPDVTMAGWFGAERWQDARLSGKPGLEQLVLDAVLFRQGTVRKADPESGLPTRLTLDMNLQSWAQNALAGLKGAVVIMRSDGELLALAEAGGPVGMLTLEDAHEEWRTRLRAGKSADLHRCLADEAGPGSVAKLAVAIAALEAGFIRPEHTLTCTGHVSYAAGSRIACHARDGGHGPVNLYEALRMSCNSYFLQVAETVGWQRIADSMTALGLGRLPTEGFADDGGGAASPLAAACGKGNIHTPESKRLAYRRPEDRVWRPIDTGLLAIGQADTRMTPLQAVVMANAIATGRRVKPRLFTHEPYAATELGIGLATREAVLQGMRQAVQHTRGTGRLARVEDVVLATKTGTFERGAAGEYRKDVWMVAVYPGEVATARLAIAFMARDMDSAGRDLGPRLGELVSAIKEWERWSEEQRQQWPNAYGNGATSVTRR